MIKIIVVGKLTQSYLKTGIDYYQKQIKESITWFEVKDEKDALGLDKEGARILKHITDQDYVIALAIEGIMYDSLSFADLFDRHMSYSNKNLTFIIGGSHGLSNQVYDRTDENISFSKMTFPHQLMRLILIEQIYRAMMIQKNHPYHK